VLATASRALARRAALAARPAVPRPILLAVSREAQEEPTDSAPLKPPIS
jgi:hypothetical protein